MAAMRALTVSEKTEDASQTWGTSRSRSRSRRQLQSPLQRAARRVIRNPMGVFGAVVLAVLAAMAVFAPLIAPYDPLAQHAGSELLPPNAQFWLGTDQFGRDEL